MQLTGYLLRPGVWVKDQVTDIWEHYFALVGIAEENQRLRDTIKIQEQELIATREDLAELSRLRTLISMSVPDTWRRVGARILTGRFGPAAILESVMIDRGFATGAAPGTPVVNHAGVIGRVLRASPNIATILLLTDRTFRISVISQESRIPGVLAGMGANAPLDVRYVAPNANLKQGDLLVSSGLDGYFPKGIPVARVTSVQPGSETLYQQVQAVPIVTLAGLENVLLLTPPRDTIPAAPRLLGAPPIIPDARPEPSNILPSANDANGRQNGTVQRMRQGRQDNGRP